MPLVSITVPTETSQVRFELQGVPDGAVALGQYNVPAPTLAYMVPQVPSTPTPIVAEGFILGNDLITINGVSGLTYYLVTIFDYQTQAVYEQEFFFINGNSLVNLDISMSIQPGPSPTSVIPLDLITPVPTYPTAPGLPGQIATDNNYLYVCIGLNQWKRIAFTIDSIWS